MARLLLYSIWLLEACMQEELSDHLEEGKTTSADIRNRRNGLMHKRVKTDYGSIEVQTPRDREGSFKSKILPKRQMVPGA